MKSAIPCLFLFLRLGLASFANDADRMLADHFEREVAEIEANSLLHLSSAEEARARVVSNRVQLARMLGLDPMPARTPLRTTVTGTAEHPEFLVENLHFQSSPGLYVTGNLYRPRETAEGARLPAVLYVCGHGKVKKGDVSYGNKVHYQHHPAWFARHGYVCLAVDTIQLGELEGMHHGTYRHGHWWWIPRGYTPAGVEAWNGVRALDLLAGRDDVDPKRIGVTGRSGGGATSWWIAALDERVAAAVPVAGITSLRNHVVDDCVEGHCDCMFMVNARRWDFAEVAALVAPRPLLVSNTDKDRIFPLDGVLDTHRQARHVYDLLGAGGRIGLNICEGGHKDTQQLRVNAFEWFERHLKGVKGSPPFAVTAEPFFEPEQLRVFRDGAPEDERTTRIHEDFVPRAAPPPPPKDAEDFARMRDAWRRHLDTEVFAGWPRDPGPLHPESRDGVIRFHADRSFRLPMRIRPGDGDTITLEICDDAAWKRYGNDPGALAAGHAAFAPRGLGSSAWTRDARERVHIRRRFALIGQTLDGMRVWDVRRAVQCLREQDAERGIVLKAGAAEHLGDIALYASLYEDGIVGVEVALSPGHREGAVLMNVLRGLDLPQAAAMAADRAPLVIRSADASAWEYPQSCAAAIGWPENRLRIDGP